MMIPGYTRGIPDSRTPGELLHQPGPDEVSQPLEADLHPVLLHQRLADVQIYQGSGQPPASLTGLSKGPYL